MPTKLEILKSNYVYRNIEELSYTGLCNLEKSLDDAMEEYAKQEAFVFYEWMFIDTSNGGLNKDDLWNEYQKSKVK